MKKYTVKAFMLWGVIAGISACTTAKRLATPLLLLF